MPAMLRVRSPQAHFVRVGAKFYDGGMASPAKTGGQLGDAPVDITILK